MTSASRQQTYHILIENTASCSHVKQCKAILGAFYFSTSQQNRQDSNYAKGGYRIGGSNQHGSNYRPPCLFLLVFFANGTQF